MLKPLFFSLTLMTACETSEKPATPGEATRTAATPATVPMVTSADGTRIAYGKAGKGPALVIVGGALSDRSAGRPLVAALDSKFTVYTYDRRGRGESGDTKPYSVAREIEDLGAVIERAGGHAYVYGVSSGAALALRSAVELGAAKLTKLAIYEPPYGQAGDAFERQKSRVTELVRTGQPGDAAAHFFSAIGTPPEALQEMKRSPEWERTRKIDFTLAYDYAILGDGDVPETVRSIAVPTLVLDGEKSLPFIRPAADRIAELVPNSRRKTLEGQTHRAAPEAVAPELIAFFGEGA